MKKLTYIAICCLFTGASFGMNGSNGHNIDDHLALSDSTYTNTSMTDNFSDSSMLSISLNTSEEYFADVESLANDVDIREFPDTVLDDHANIRPNGTIINTNNIVVNLNNEDVNRHNGLTFSGENVFNIGNTNAISEESLSASECYTENDYRYLVDSSSSSSDSEIDFLNSSSSTSSFEFM